MSISILNRVWQNSKATKGDLLIMLAIADFANDAGEAWPSVPTLAKKSRLKERQTQYVLRRLVRSGELKISKNKGPQGCHLYHITIPADTGAGNAPVQKLRGALDGNRGAFFGIQGGHSTAPEPSVNHHKNRQCSPSPAQSSASPTVAGSAEKPPPSSLASRSARVKSPSLPSQAGLEFADWFRSTLPDSFSLPANWREDWGRAFDALVRLDKRTPAEIRRVSEWARADSFLASQFLSPLKLRRSNKDGVTYFDDFSAKMNGSKARHKPSREIF